VGHTLLFAVGARPPHDGVRKARRSTVYNIFRKFQKDGVWEAIWEELHTALREQLGREASPTAAIIDSRTLKAAEKGAVLMAR
jgi:transposase